MAILYNQFWKYWPTLDPDGWTEVMAHRHCQHVWAPELVTARGLCSPSGCWPRGSCFAQYICTSSAKLCTAISHSLSKLSPPQQQEWLCGTLSPMFLCLVTKCFTLLNDFQKWCNVPFLDKIQHVIFSRSESGNFLCWSDASYTTL